MRPRSSRRSRRVLDTIEAMDPERDCAEIYRLHTQIEFPWDVARALELALYRTYCVPSIGGLLHATQEFEQRTQKRYDDTALLLAQVSDRGFADPRGRDAVRRINQIHGRFDISNDDMRYVLSTFVAVPLRWLDRFGWRPVSDAERIATHAYYRELGRRMGIREIPATWPEMLAFSDAYERDHFAYSEANSAVGTATRELFVRWLRWLPAPLVRTGVHALLDQPVLDAFGFRPAPKLVTRAAELGLQARAKLVRRLPERTKPVKVADSWLVRSYPHGYAIAQLGPDGSRLPGASEPQVGTQRVALRGSGSGRTRSAG